MSDKTEEFGQAPSEPHDEYGRPVKARKITEEESLIFASGEFLCEHIPVEFFDWKEDKQDEFLEGNVHEGCRYINAKDIWELMDNLAWSIRDNFVKKVSDE